ncbi:inner membrane transporter RhtA [Nocardiopsis mwathae]|uniref:Inner membrane transporter RhtA n=2 Tax=Nocardiopsis mwathae TaxID=1472723 RepID=A0A7W9YH85_9ACTN|nr:EamA family transporter [Nocardiopsis mwathae]MBB6171481.1 inner membrane transporter RhtA [Nocardiopsis mwathae]
MFALHTGSSLAVTLFDEMGSLGVTWLRLTWAALILLALGGRPLWAAFRGASKNELVTVVILGTVSAGMMAFYSESTARIDLGTATAIEFLGPLAVAVLAMRRPREFMWIAFALLGVVFLTQPWHGEADLTGVAFGLGGAAFLGFYIVYTQRVGSSFRAIHGLALSMTVASVLMAPLGVPEVAANPDPHVVLVTLGIALLFPVIPFLLEMMVLQRMSRTTYSTLASLEPAVSLVMGMVVISQHPALAQIGGIALVVIAGVGAARGDSAVTDPALSEQSVLGTERAAPDRAAARPHPDIPEPARRARGGARR